MKKAIVIILSVWMSVNLYGQQQKKDYAYYNHRIDSLTLVYSVEQYVDVRNTYVNFRNSILNAKEKKKLIVKIKYLFEQNEYVNLYHFGHYLLYNLWWVYPDDNLLEIKQTLMEIYLQYYFYPEKDIIIDSYQSSSNLLYTQKAKKRLIEILKGEKTKEEYELYLKYIKSLPLTYVKASWDIAASLMKQREIQNETVLSQIRDSLLNDYINRVTTKDFNFLQMEPKLVKTIGLLDMKECIPIMQKKLQEGVDNDNRGEPEKSYRCALARLGDKEQHQYILDNLMDIEEFDRRDFIYFQNDEMIWKYIAVNYFSDKRIFPVSHGEGITAGLMTMNNIWPFIKNLPEQFIYPRKERINEHYLWSESLYEWLMANKESIVFDYEGDKDEKWFW